MGRRVLAAVTLLGLMAVGPAAFAQTGGTVESQEEKPAAESADADTAPNQKPVRGGGEDETLSPGTPKAVAEAREHFMLALEEYRHGDYDGASWELHWAVYLDPSSKDLEYNLALVHEKQGELREAIEHWRRYQLLERSSAERERADLAIERLEAVQARNIDAETAGERVSTSSEQLPESAAPAKPFRNWAIGSGIVAVTALCASAALGIRALSIDPNRDSSVGAESLAELEARAQRAHAYAVSADVALAVGVGAGVAAGLFWFAEPSSPQDLLATSPRSRARAVGFRVGGRF